MIHEYLTSISKMSLAIWLAALIFSFVIKHISFTTDSKTSFEPVLLIACVTAVIQICWEIYVGALFGVPELKHEVRALWHFGFAFTNWLMVLSCLFVIRKFDLKSAYTSIAVMSIYAVLGMLQLARYCDRFMLETDVLGYVYRNGIPAANTIITILAIWSVASVLAVSLNLKRGRV